MSEIMESLPFKTSAESARLQLQAKTIAPEDVAHNNAYQTVHLLYAHPSTARISFNGREG